MVVSTSASPASTILKGSREQSALRTRRIKRGLTQLQLAELVGIHRNSLRTLENDPSHEVTPEVAEALASALATTIAALGLRMRLPQRSIRIRRLTPDQRQIVHELLSLPPEDYEIIRRAIAKLRQGREQGRGNRPRRRPK